MTTAPTDTAVFDRLVHWKVFRPTAEHLFPTTDSLRWFIRTHADELQSAGAVLKLARGTYIDPQPFRAVAIPLMQGASARGVQS